MTGGCLGMIDWRGGEREDVVEVGGWESEMELELELKLGGGGGCAVEQGEVKRWSVDWGG